MAPWLRGCGILHGCIGGVVCAVCVLLITTPLVACTTTFVIGTSYNAVIPNAPMLIYYINGLYFATTGATEDGVSYSSTSSSVGLWTQWPPTCSIASSMVQQGAVAIFGPPGTYAVADLYENQMTSPNTVFFGPLAENLYSGPISFLLYQPGIFWTIPTEGAQALGLLDYLEQRPLFPQNQLMLYQWYTNSGIGCVARLLFQEVMPLLGVSGYDSCSDGGSSSSFESLSSSPRIVYLFEAYTNSDNTEDTGTSSWITNLISNPTLIAANITVATPFYIHSYVVGLYNSWHSQSPTAEMLPPQNVISSAPTPGVDSTEYSVTQDFLTSVLTVYGCTNNACKNFELAGWVNAKALMHALSMYGEVSSQSPSSYFYTTLLAAQSSFLVSDLFIGSFGPQAGCGAVALSQGAVCGCNQAGMNVFFMQLKWVGGVVDVVTIPGASFQYAKGKCASVVLPGSEPLGVSPFNELFTFVPMKRLVGLALIDNTMMMDMCNSVSAVSAALSNRTLYQHLAPNGYVVYCISTTTASMSSDLTSHMSTYVTTSMTGVIPDSMIDSIATPSTFVLDFMPQTTQPRVMLQNLVYLFPTLDQELYVLASYLYGILTASSVVCGAVRTSSVSSAIVTLLTKTLTTFQLAVDSDHMVQTSGALGSSIPSACTHTFVVGLDEDDAAGVAAYLHSHTSAVVLLSFDDVTKYYSPLQTSFGGQGGSLTDRLLFATNLPSWTATPSDPTAAAASAPLSTVSQFLQSAPDSMHTPAALRAFLVAMMYDLLSAGHGSASDVQQLLYDAVTVVMDGVHFGPFSEECTAVASTCSAGWVSNAGATDIAVWSYTRVVTPSTPLMLEPATPSMIYTTARTSSTGLEASALSLPPSGRSVGDTMCVLISDSSASRNSQFTSQSTSLSGSLSSFPPTRAPLPSSSSRAYESRESLTTIDDVLVFVGVALCVMVLVVLLLRLWKSGVLFRIAKRVRYVLSCYRCTRASRSPKGGRRRTEADCRLEQRSRDASRFVPATKEGRTIVCVIADYWRPLWVRVPEVMCQAAEYYQRSVREAVVRHGCVEMRAVDGLFTVMCPSASASMLLVLDIHQSLQSMRTVLREALTAAYRSFGVVCADVHDPQPFRVRVGVDTVVGGDGSCAGSDICTDGCVEVATRAAYRNCSGSVLCVMTKRTRSGLTDEELLSLQICVPSAGTHVLRCGQSEFVMELFVVMSSASVTEVSAFSSPANERSCEVALRMLSNDVDATSVSTARCTATLSALYSALPTLRVELLEAMLHSFALPVLSRSTCANDMDYANALVSALARHLGGLLECRHGIPPGLRRSGDVSGVSREEGCSVVEEHVESRASGRSGHGNLHMSGRHVRLQASNRTNTVVLRRFAYGSNHLCDASGDRVGDVQ